jgi:uncharacterized repeat protein (TIGR03803 family)
VKKSLLAAFIVTLLLPTLALAQKSFTTLYFFNGTTDGAHPSASVIGDSAGNLYGTTNGGGSSNDGVVFSLNTSGQQTVLYNFAGGSDGYGPFTPLLRDSHGNLYGVTSQGGSNSDGVVFKIDPSGNEAILHTFAGGTDGCHPSQGLIMANGGTLYGTFGLCGSNYSGGVFKLTSDGTYTVLHNFAGAPSDGAIPHGGHLIMDKNGDLYGVTLGGGRKDQGVLYKLSKNGTVTVLHSFAGGKKDGCQPQGTVAIDTAGDFYGIANACGAFNYGIVWKVSNKQLSVLHNFSGQADGSYPNSGVVLNAKGIMFGVAEYGGSGQSGVLYKLGPKGKFTVLHTFDGSDGGLPNGEVLRKANGDLYGTTNIGGNFSGCGGTGCGTVWAFK